MLDIKIIVATHKSYWMPKDSIYVPVQAGSAGKPSIKALRDDNGENISLKNQNYCELTALYWAWKNIHAEVIGLMHYRRYMRGKKSFFKAKKEQIASRQDIEDLLELADIIVPKPRHYYVENVYDHFVHAHGQMVIDLAGEIIMESCPKYLKAFLQLKENRSAHIFNIFIMKYDVFNAYCEWLFDILFTLENRLAGNYPPRIFGFISERLLDVWITTNKVSYVECDVVNLERQNYLYKASGMLKRKFICQTKK